MQDNIFQIIANALLAAFGAMARQLNSMHKEPLNPAAFISGCFIAAFMGVIIYFVADYFGLNGNLAYAVAGVSGWIGPQMLDKLSHLIMKTIGIDIDETKNKDEDGGK